MTQPIIQVQHLSKKFIIGHEKGQAKYTALRDIITEKATAIIRRKEKFLPTEEFWALDDVNFDVQQGDSVGIIGRNGAGKSTLLKVLSRITEPTKGRITLKGRVASLLEVGTGFHPELSGRENIYLNGAILGMSRAEIKMKFDEIVDFAGIEKFLDTPVKRYSSGMYVRLAFAVAAHLEPEILVVDEVLAVGDAEFQKKCLGKMKEVSTKEGRTVLFVSHNMNAVASLCTSAVYLRNGKVAEIGPTESVLNKYLMNETGVSTTKIFEKNKPGDDIAVLHSARLIDTDHNPAGTININQRVGVEYVYEVLKPGYAPIPNMHLYTAKNELAFVTSENVDPKLFGVGKYKAIVWIPEHLLNVGTYMVGIALSTMNPLIIHFYALETLIFEVIENVSERTNGFNQPIPGVVRPRLQWNTVLIN